MHTDMEAQSGRGAQATELQGCHSLPSTPGSLAGICLSCPAFCRHRGVCWAHRECSQQGDNLVYCQMIALCYRKKRMALTCRRSPV